MMHGTYNVKSYMYFPFIVFRLWNFSSYHFMNFEVKKLIGGLRFCICLNNQKIQTKPEPTQHVSHLQACFLETRNAVL